MEQIHVSADFIFGTMATDSRRLGYVRAEMAGISHRYRMEPAAPQAGEPVRLFVTLGPSIIADRVCVYYTTDGSEPTGRRGQPAPGSAVAQGQRLASHWDTLLWGYMEEWAIDLPPQPSGAVVRYRIEAWLSKGEGSLWYSEVIGATEGDGSVLGHPGPGDHYLREMGAEFNLTFFRRPRTCAYRVGDEGAPAWLDEAVIYHIFIDRFHPGPDRQFAHPPTPMGIYGGTLAGVTAKLDYIASLGTTAIWLSPLFPSPSHHGYNATDYYSVEPRMGTLADLQTLIAAAHDRGMRVILDYTANHFSSRHPIFQRAITDPSSPERDWFTFTQYPDKYVSFFGVAELPQLDLDHPPARQFMIDAARYWLEQGVDGYRLDYTIGPSHDFWTAFRAAMRAIKFDCVLLGEAVDTAEVLRSYIGRLDGCLDFLLLQAIRRFFAFDEIKASTFAIFLNRHLAYFPPGFALPSFLDNHDMNRFLWVARGDTRRLRLAALCQYTLPHPPVLYYGTEVGLSQRLDVRHADGSGHPEEARLPMLWDDDQDRDLLQFYRQLGALRRSTTDIWRGERTFTHIDDQHRQLAYTCTANGATWLVALNNAPHVGAIPLPAGRWEVALATQTVDVIAGNVILPAYGGAILRRPE
ncbi:alpha-amylase family glycosyl hydrolase [Chloroflexus sp.]|uniref:alpha-amylase family glycosyl hydrolase n=1 Tax=Chloroflexus sp. TaxID=1904827 RepID=UPI002ACEF567|nr:alpha-amylase family glycosyl hydrolase [Chloroflexus sp.]